jgi:hypothetical protein
MFLTWKQWALLHYFASQGMPAVQISNLRFKQARKSLKFGANCGTQASLSSALSGVGEKSSPRRS